MTYNDALKYIHSLGKFRLPAGLERIESVCKKLSNPQKAFKSIHIAGTNGKGSTAAMLSNIYIKQGLKVGLYISPYIVIFNERIQICGRYIPDDRLTFYTETVKSTGVKLNEFEFITVVAFLYFRDENIDVAVIETGLGGRLDATNVITDTAVSVITKIGLDHTAILGETAEQIATEKCGIIKPNRPVVTVCNQEKSILSVIEKYTDDLTVAKTPEILKSDLSGSEFLYNGRNYKISLLGKHQVYNAATVLETVEKAGIEVSDLSVYDGLLTASFPARLEIVSNAPLTVIDGAHNPDGGLVLARFIESLGEKVAIVCGMLRDKNCEEFIKQLPENIKVFATVNIDNPRSASAEELEIIGKKYFEETVAFVKTEDAVNFARTSKIPVFFVGSLYLAAQVRKYYKK